MTRLAVHRVFFALLLMVCVLPGCAVYQKCGVAGCPGDAEITEGVKSQFEQHADLGPVALFTIKTLDGVVYLSGTVDTDLQKYNAEEIALQVPNVKRVINSINSSNAPH